MSKRKLWTLIAAPSLAATTLLLLFLLLGQSTVRSQSSTFTVSGIVSYTEPISDVEVYVWNRYKGTGFLGYVTDSSGYYSVTLEEGNYELNFTPPRGYASQSHKGIVGPPDQILNVVLSPGYTISGTVTGGIGNVAIYAFNRDTADGFGLPPTDGHFCFGLVTGTYELSFTPPPCLGLGPHTEEITITQDTSLTVTLPPGFTVAGCVTDESGKKVAGVQIYAKDPNIGGFGFAPTNESGCYTGTLPLPGTYDIQFMPPPGLGSVTITDVTNTTAGCPNTTLPITLPVGFTLSGGVTCNGRAIKGVFVYAEPEGPHDPAGYGVFTVDDGSYGLPLVPGTYELDFTPPEAAGLDARAFTTIELITNTVLDVEFCLCSGAWVTETIDQVGDVGAYTSLALEPTYPYAPHISYRDVTSDGLKYAWGGATWISQTVDSPGGQWTSLALAPAYPYTPCISYADYDSRWQLRYACLSGTTWISTMIGRSRTGSFGTSLALEPTYPYNPHISYYYPIAGAQHLGHAYLSGTTWCSGTWMAEGVEEGPVGTWSSLALDLTYPYTSHISYQDGANKNLKYAWLSGTTWLSQTIDSKGDVGWYTSLALDSGGNPHISYFDNTNDTLKYAWLSGTIWLSETVDSAGGPWYGWDTSLALDRANRPYISYYDNGDLKLAHFDGKVWIAERVDSKGDVGPFSSLALDPMGCPHISYYDATNGDLKYAYIPPYYVYLPLIMRNHPE